jgi:hypothetical protein
MNLEAHSELDKYFRLIALLVLFLWNLFVATRMETPYPEILVELYALPASRLVLLGTIIALSFWCPTVTIMAALAFVCLGSDVIFLTK